MSHSEREKWNRRYGEPDLTMGPHPSAFLVETLPLVEQWTTGRRALDIACGEGRNSIFLAQHGFRTTGVDNSDVGLQKARTLSAGAGLDIDYRLMDLREEVPCGPFDLVVVFNFLLRPLIPKLYDALAPGGFLAMEAVMQGEDARHNPEFVVVPGEMDSLVAGYAGSIVTSSEDAEREKARVLFRKA